MVRPTIAIASYSTGSIPLDEWCFIAMVWTVGTGVDYYIDGVYDSSSAFTSYPASQTVDAVTVGSHGSYNLTLDGYMDDVRIDRGELTSTQILAMKNGTSPTNTPALLYTFDQRDCLIPDISQNNNNGTAVNEPTIGAAR